MINFNRTTMLTMTAAAALAIGACSADAPASNDMAMANEMAPPADMSINDVAPVTVGGAEMLPTKTIVENASAAPNLTTLVSAVTLPAWSRRCPAPVRSPSSRRPTTPSPSSPRGPSKGWSSPPPRPT